MPPTDTVDHKVGTTRTDDIIDQLENRARGTAPFSAAGADLAGRNLRGLDLSGLDLTGADLTDADLTDADLTDARLFKSNLTRATMRRAILKGAECTGADFTGAHMEEIDARGAGFGMAILKDSQIFGANLAGAVLSKADLTDANLGAARLRNARLREACLVGTNMVGADLQGCDFALCDVAGAVFNNADMREARLRAISNFKNAEWYGVDIHNINFAGAYRVRRHIIDENFLKEFRQTGRKARVAYELWRLTSDCGRSITRWFVCVLLVSCFFASVYVFTNIDYGPHQTWISPWYFSVVTLTTLGYGDILPVSVGAKLVVMTEVAIGYLMFGGLISIFANKMARRGD